MSAIGTLSAACMTFIAAMVALFTPILQRLWKIRNIKKIIDDEMEKNYRILINIRDCISKHPDYINIHPEYNEDYRKACKQGYGPANKLKFIKLADDNLVEWISLQNTLKYTDAKNYKKYKMANQLIKYLINNPDPTLNKGKAAERFIYEYEDLFNKPPEFKIPNSGKLL